MTPEEKFKQTIWWVLQEIKKESLATRKDYYIYFEFQSSKNSDNNSVPSKEDQRRAVRLLENKDAIRIEGNKYPQPFTMDFIAQMSNIKPIGCFLEILQPKFYKFYNKFAKNLGEEIQTQQSNKKIEFIDNKAILKLGEKSCQLPPYKNEHFFCRVVFEYAVKEPIDWSTIYEKMTGYYEEHFGKPKGTRENWRQVYDTMEAINKRVREIFGIKKLFTWQEKTVKRSQ